jgi:hypothetical protein
MPKILVISTPTTEQHDAVTLEEVVEPEHFESPHHAAQLIERVGWAVTDAKQAEGHAAPSEAQEHEVPQDVEDLWNLTGPAMTQGAVSV